LTGGCGSEVAVKIGLARNFSNIVFRLILKQTNKHSNFQIIIEKNGFAIKNL
jgi:hypothetical protein